MKDEIIEKNRYNKASKNFLAGLEKNKLALKVLAADNFPLYLRPPYLYYHELISQQTFPGKKQLDLCCGNGIHSFTGAKNGASVIGIDYAEESIIVCKQRASILNLNVEFITADVESLNFRDESFDLVSCVGSLSYLNHEILLREVYRVLKKDGVFICLDSFNCNPVYRFNRYIHYLRGQRSYSTLRRMPNMNTLKLVNEIFSKVDVKYFGIFTFLSPFLSIVLSPEKILQVLTYLDKHVRIFKRHAFKIVINAQK